MNAVQHTRRPGAARAPRRPALATLGLLAAATLLAACAGSGRPTPAALQPLAVHAPVGVQWSARLGSAPTLGSTPLRLPEGAGGTLVWSTADGSIVALDEATGALRWRHSVGAPLASGAGSDGQRHAAVTQANALVVLDAQGQRLWQQMLSARALTAPLVAGGRVFVQLLDRSVQAHDAQDGALLWRFRRPSDPLSLNQPGVLQAVGDTLIVGHGPRLLGLDPNSGNVRWEAPLASPRGTNEVERLADLVGPAQRQGSVLCARAFQASVACVDASSGALRWSRPAQGAQPIGGDATLLAGGDGSDRIVAWRTGNGDVAWRQEALLNRGLSGFGSVGEWLATGDAQGLLHLLRREDGALAGRISTDGTPVVGAPVVTPSATVFTTRGGGIYALRAGR